LSATEALTAAAIELIKSRGAVAVYTQLGSPQTFNIYIDHDLEILDESGAGQYVSAAIIAKSDFYFPDFKVNDTILQDSRTWKVKGKLEEYGLT